MDDIKQRISEAASCTEAFRLLLQVEDPQATLRVLNFDRSLCGQIWVQEGTTITAASLVTGSTGYLALFELLMLKQSHFQLAASIDLADGKTLQVPLSEVIEDEAKFIDKIKGIIQPEQLPETVPSEEAPKDLADEAGLTARKLKDSFGVSAQEQVLPPAKGETATPMSAPAALPPITERIPRGILIPAAIALIILPLVAGVIFVSADREKRATAEDSSSVAAEIDRVMDEQAATRQPQQAFRVPGA